MSPRGDATVPVSPYGPMAKTMVLDGQYACFQVNLTAQRA